MHCFVNFFITNIEQIIVYIQQSYEKDLQKLTVNFRKLSQKFYRSVDVLECISSNALKIALKELDVLINTVKNELLHK